MDGLSETLTSYKSSNQKTQFARRLILGLVKADKAGQPGMAVKPESGSQMSQVERSGRGDRRHLRTDTKVQRKISKEQDLEVLVDSVETIGEIGGSDMSQAGQANQVTIRFQDQEYARQECFSVDFGSQSITTVFVEKDAEVSGRVQIESLSSTDHSPPPRRSSSSTFK